jgi:hypothetical protein
MLYFLKKTRRLPLGYIGLQASKIKQIVILGYNFLHLQKINYNAILRSQKRFNFQKNICPTY